MQFFTEEKRAEFRKLTGALPSKVYVPLNAGRRVGKRPTTDPQFPTHPPADQVDLEAWINYKITQGDIVVNTTTGDITADTVTADDLTVSSGLTLSGVPTYADDAAAGVGGLTEGQVYQTATGELRIKTA